MPEKILVVDDDPMLSELVAYNLQADGYEVVTAGDGQEGLRQFYSERPDLVILDVAMPKLDGYQVCQRIREMSDTPVIMLTARGQEEEIIRGLDLGADDYITKPFQVTVLSARVRATLRRAKTEPMVGDGPNYSDPYLTIDLEARQITVDGEMVKLTPTEFKLLAVLVRNKGRVVEFRQLLESVWGFEYIDDVDYLRVYIWHLRRKLEPDSKEPIYLLNELNVGYRFMPRS
jgi:two-component system KDP operon response regulator KdpE